MIELEGVGREYQMGEEKVYALRDVSLKVEEGEFVSIVGRSGSGKSTLMNLIGCLDRPSEGQYRLAGRSVAQLSDRELSVVRNRVVGFIFQGFNLVQDLTALENVELPLVYRGWPRAKRRQAAQTALEQLGLAERMDHRPGQMSGGQQQRVAIARAVAANPSLILADEPTGNLDSRAGEEVMHLLTGLWRQGKTVLLITHDPVVAACAPRRIIIDGGRGEKEG
ncbi:MAG: ABC transporter ATP-binding protein [Oscillospiraceae bacterium]|nr:ABC transporter ATP-binding protein [Oscillospiraceae bacterium]